MPKKCTFIREKVPHQENCICNNVRFYKYKNLFNKSHFFFNEITILLKKKNSMHTFANFLYSIKLIDYI